MHVPEASVKRVDPVFRSVIRCKDGKTILFTMLINKLIIKLEFNKDSGLIVYLYNHVYSIQQ